MCVSSHKILCSASLKIVVTLHKRDKAAGQDFSSLFWLFLLNGLSRLKNQINTNNCLKATFHNTQWQGRGKRFILWNPHFCLPWFRNFPGTYCWCIGRVLSQHMCLKNSTLMQSVDADVFDQEHPSTTKNASHAPVQFQHKFEIVFHLMTILNLKLRNGHQCTNSIMLYDESS